MTSNPSINDYSIHNVYIGEVEQFPHHSHNVIIGKNVIFQYKCKECLKIYELDMREHMKMVYLDFDGNQYSCIQCRKNDYKNRLENKIYFDTNFPKELIKIIVDYV
jgi:hypothetical protein